MTTGKNVKITKLRSEIDRVDAQMLALAKRRFDMVEGIAAAKRASGMATKDEKREAQVLQSWRDNASRLGLPRDLADEILASVLKHSNRMQVSESPEKVMLVGYGAMADALAMALRTGGHDVYVTGRNMAKARRFARRLGIKASSSVLKPFCRHVVLCLPPDAISGSEGAETIKGMRGRIIYDILSSKSSDAIAALRLAADRIGFDYVSMHPLFGPGSAGKSLGLKIAAIPVSASQKAMEEASALWRSVGMDFVGTTIEEHERAMAIVQVLRHMYSIAFYRSVNALSGILGRGYERLATDNFESMLKSASSIASQEWVAREIAELNPYSGSVFREGKRQMGLYIKGMKVAPRGKRPRLCQD